MPCLIYMHLPVSLGSRAHISGKAPTPGIYNLCIYYVDYMCNFSDTCIDFVVSTTVTVTENPTATSGPNGNTNVTRNSGG